MLYPHMRIGTEKGEPSDKLMDQAGPSLQVKVFNLNTWGRGQGDRLHNLAHFIPNGGFLTLPFIHSLTRN